MGCLRDHLMIANPGDPRLVPPKLDLDDQYYLWVFNQLNRSRVYDQGCPYSISLSTFRDYMTLFDDELDTDEVLLLQELDDAFVHTMIKNRE